MFHSESEFWKHWYPRAVLVICCILQFVLTILGAFRKDSYSQILKFLIWICYNLADLVSYASIVFPFIDLSETDHRFIAVWAAFYLMFLGGTDTLTALSLQDNELWGRRALSIIVKGSVCVFAIFQCFLEGMPVMFSFIVIPTVIGGVYNCVERILALYWGRKNEFKSSSQGKGRKTAKPDFYSVRDNALAIERSGLPMIVLTVVEHVQEPSPWSPPSSFSSREGDTIKTLMTSSRLYKKFRGLFTDNRYSYEDRKSSQSLIGSMPSSQVVQVAHDQIRFASDEIHSRALLSHTKTGLVSRLCFLLVIVCSFIWFVVVGKHGFLGHDVVITYLVVILEILKRVFALLWLVFSRQQIVQITKSKCSSWECIVKFILKFHPLKKPKLSMGQIDLFKIYFNHSKPSLFNRYIPFIFPKEVCDNYSLTKQVVINDDTRDVICEFLKKKSSKAEETGEYRSLMTSRGEWALKQGNYHEKLGWSVEREFGDCALTWTIATTLLYHCQDLTRSNKLEIAKYFSDYFLHLLRVRPVLLSSIAPDVVQTSIDTFSELESLLNRVQSWNNEREASQMILLENTDYDFSRVMGDESRSVFWNGIKLAQELLQLNSMDRELILCEVWVEMLSYAAIHSSGEYHMQLLGEGGELLTVLWLITNLLGLGKQFKFECRVASTEVGSVQNR